MEQGPFDELVDRLHQLRTEAGVPSFGEIEGSGLKDREQEAPHGVGIVDAGPMRYKPPA